MAYYHTCPYCGANLDPGESCDCRDSKPIKTTKNQPVKLKEDALYAKNRIRVQDRNQNLLSL